MADTSQDTFTWSARAIDHEYCGSWDWTLKPDELADVLQFLENLQKLRWGEIEAQRTGGRERHKKHHFMDVHQLCQEARQRLESISTDAEVPEKLFRFRLTGKQRLWGHRRQGCFHILWFDRDHCVYPVD